MGQRKKSGTQMKRTISQVPQEVLPSISRLTRFGFRFQSLNVQDLETSWEKVSWRTPDTSSMTKVGFLLCCFRASLCSSTAHPCGCGWMRADYIRAYVFCQYLYFCLLVCLCIKLVFIFRKPFCFLTAVTEGIILPLFCDILFLQDWLQLTSITQGVLFGAIPEQEQLKWSLHFEASLICRHSENSVQ